MSAPSSFEARLASVWPVEQWKDVTVLVAVSGGPDSVALLRGLVAIRQAGAGGLLAAHFNHGLRAEESDADERFVVELCRSLGVPIEVGRANPSAFRWPAEVANQEIAYPATRGVAEGHPEHTNPPRTSLKENTARQVRYAFFKDTAARSGARYVVTAHTADDQAETILHRIIRGTGIAGLVGMARARPLAPGITLFRPLLGFRRAHVLAYLAEINQSYRVDSSNLDLGFTRNRIRHLLLPLLAKDFSPAIVDSLVRLGALAAEVQAVVDAEAAELADCAVVFETSGAVRVRLDRLCGRARYLIREMLMALWRRQTWPLQAMGFAEWNLVADMAEGACLPGAKPCKRVFPGGVLAETVEGELRLHGPKCG